VPAPAATEDQRPMSERTPPPSRSRASTSAPARNPRRGPRHRGDDRGCSSTRRSSTLLPRGSSSGPASGSGASAPDGAHLPVAHGARDQRLLERGEVLWYGVLFCPALRLPHVYEWRSRTGGQRRHPAAQAAVPERAFWSAHRVLLLVWVGMASSVEWSSEQDASPGALDSRFGRLSGPVCGVRLTVSLAAVD